MKIKNLRELIGIRKKSGLPVVLLVAVILICLIYFLFMLLNPREKVIELTSNGFYPNELHIDPGTEVFFKSTLEKDYWPASNLHPSHSIHPEFDPKRALKPNEVWSIVFKDEGIYRFHDHLFPNFTGVIFVGKSSKTKLNEETINQCVKVEKEKKNECWDNLLQETARQQGFSDAFELFVELYNTEKDIPKGCHGWAHVLGKTAYFEYKENNNDLLLRPEVSYCGYGFFHGFIEQLVLDTGEIKKALDFCENIASKSGVDAGVYSNCVHGIGHGSVDVDDKGKWGDFQAMINPGLKNCEAIFKGKPSDLQNCYDGAFNAMALNDAYGEYGLKFNKNDIFERCRDQKKEHKKSCYFEYIGLSQNIAKHSFDETAKLFLNEDIDLGEGKYGFSKMAADFMQGDIVKSEWSDNLRVCNSIPSEFYQSCFGGILSGFISHGLPGKEYIKGLEFCRGEYLREEEKDSCYRYFLSRPGNSDLKCEEIEQQYQKYCVKS